ncbi:MAG: glycosyltransferase family 2 protein [Euryarchaeota archaeon]|nr:glycosyltransferase family 2 protein [Euryarchaeota archaeon]
MKPEVTLAVMVRNEEKYIDQCLKYHIPHVSHTVLLDGGSIDKTLEIVGAYDVTIFKEAEEGVEDSFAARRNLMAKKCSTEWVLMVDADELFDYDFLTNMVQYIASDSILRREHVAAFRFPRLNLDNGNPIDYHVRLYKQYVCEWRGQVHEKLYLKGTDLRVDQAKVGGFEICQTLEGHNIIHLQRPKEDRLAQRGRWDELAEDT